jgi:hypothetical protein
VTSVGRPSNRTGGEISLGYAPTPWLSHNGDFAFTRARFTAPDTGVADVWPGHPGNYVLEVAKEIGSAEMAIQNLGSWDGGLRVRYFGPRPLVEDGSVRSGLPRCGMLGSAIASKRATAWSGGRALSTRLSGSGRADHASRAR